jgi:acid phosphatase
MQAGDLPGQYRSHAAKDSLKFIVIGDFGTGGKEQLILGAEMLKRCEIVGGCDFVLTVGDNIYNSGVHRPSDLDRRFETPYAGFGRIDFWLVPGNHDWSAPGSVRREIEHSLVSERWRMPFNHYGIPGLPEWIHIYGVDTTIFEQAFRKKNSIVIDNKDTQLTAARTALCGKNGWKFLFGHHAIYSGGEHGDGGGTLKEQKAFLEPLIRDCGVQAYFAGHDHHQEYIQANGFVQIVQGAGGKGVRPVKDTSGESHQSIRRSAQFGFALVELDRRQMVIRFFECGTKLGECRPVDVATLSP